MWRIREFRSKIKWAWQRAVRGYSDCDVWNIDAWFLEIMPKMLKQLNEERIGHPCDLTDKQWSKILNKMINCFTEANEDTCSKKNPLEADYDKMLEEFELIKKQYEEKTPEGSTIVCMPASDKVGRKDWQELTENYLKEETKLAKYREKKLADGLDLFKENFWGLWD